LKEYCEITITIITSRFNLLLNLKNIQEIVSAGGSTVWGNPADVGSVVGGEAFDVVLDNNGKDLEAVRFVVLILVSFCSMINLYCMPSC
jgi:hypothetical protein